MKNILIIKKLTVKTNNKIILSNINLSINKGEIHAIMGPNGSGKTTLSRALVKDPEYITEGTILYKNEDTINFSTEMCAQKGIFLTFQNPISIPGVTNIQFIKSSINTIKKFKNEQPLDIIEFTKIIKKNIKLLNMS